MVFSRTPTTRDYFAWKSLPRFEALQERYADKAFVNCCNTSSVPISRFPSVQTIESFYRSQQSGLNQYPLTQVLGWLDQDLEYVRSSGCDESGIARIRRENSVDLFDMVLIDGSEFTGTAELDEVYGAKWLLLDDINTYKNFENHQRLNQDDSYELLVENRHLRNGYSIFRRKETASIKVQYSQQQIDQGCRGYSDSKHWRFFETILKNPAIKNICILGVYFGRDIGYLAGILRNLGRYDCTITGVDKFEDAFCDDWEDGKEGLPGRRPGSALHLPWKKHVQISLNSGCRTA
ncbi:MAG: hypothetical protein IPP74_15235 [Alphaproteobacteria bacterium]|nr:hypothetical protein [Alphaproteobacteria bacterium]